MKYSAFSIIIAGFLTPLPLAAVEFNINAIDKDQRGNVDLSQFKDKNHVAPGHYFVTVAINNTPLANGWQLARYKKRRYNGSLHSVRSGGHFWSGR